MQSVLTEFINLLSQGITTLAQNIGSGLQQAVTSIFLDTSGSTPVLSTFGGVVAIFGGIALAVGFVTLVFNWIMNIGK